MSTEQPLSPPKVGQSGEAPNASQQERAPNAPSTPTSPDTSKLGDTNSNTGTHGPPAEPGKTTQKKLSGLARINEWLESTPSKKLLLTIFAIVGGLGQIYGFINTQFIAPAREQRRQALDRAPRMLLVFANTRCRLLNQDSWEVLDASVTFSSWLVDVTSCSEAASASGAFSAPLAAKRDLHPNEEISADVPEGMLGDLLANPGSGLFRCGEPSHDCQWMAICSASYFRRDREPFGLKSYAFASAGRLQNVDELRTYSSSGGPWEEHWGAARDQRAFECLKLVSQQHAAADEVMKGFHR